MSKKPIKVTNAGRTFKKGIVVDNYKQFVEEKVPELFNCESDQIRIVLDEDGTEIDDDEYFQTLQPNTILMILQNDQKWSHFSTPVTISFDQVDDAGSSVNTGHLLRRLKSDASNICLMSDIELEALKDLEPEEVTNYDDKVFLDQVKEASTHYLSDRRDAKDAIELLKMFRNKEQISD